MSTETADPGHGHSPAAWTAVIIMLIAFTIGTVAFFFDVAVARLGLGGPPASSAPSSAGCWPRAGYGVGGAKVAREGALRVLADLDAELRRRRSARRAETQPSPTSRPRRSRARPHSTRSRRCAPPTRVKVIAEVKRSSPSRGAARRRSRDPAALAAQLRDRRSERDQRAHRGAPVRRLARRPRGRARRGRAARAAQGLHRDAVPGVRGPRRRRRPRAAHRRRARRPDAARAATTSSSRSA